MATKTARCFCSTFEFGTFDVDTDDDYTTGCTESTTKIFAQGHDAKLVGFMVRAEMAGQEIRRGSLHFAGAVQAAASISEALAAKAQVQLDAAKTRLAKKALVEAKKAARRSVTAERKLAEDAGVVTPEPTTREARIKVGRWEYNATIEIATGRATHERKLGGTRTVELGEYKEV